MLTGAHMGDAVTMELFSISDKISVLTLLKNADLPIEDLTDYKLKNFMVAKHKDGSVVGVVGIEMYQKSGLLRSLAVHPSYRGKGLGRHLTREIESFACQNGIETLYLLTMTAADFFPKIGYEVMQRDKVPESIRRTEEFKNVCPVSAVCLFKVLDVV
jgi:amino-acid N-acetyltransferase